MSLCVLACGCAPPPDTHVGGSLPRVVPPQGIHKVIDAVPHYTTFAYSGLCFFNGKLYVSTNIGMLEVEGGRPAALYKWHDRDDVITGPWPDPADGLLWARHEGLDKLLRYDGKTWAVTEHPRPKGGFMRGDILAGFRGTGTPEGFWLEGGRHAWRWDSRAGVWEEARRPQEGGLAGVVPLPGKMLVIMRHEVLPYLVKRGEDFNSDTVHYYDGGWKEVPNNTGKGFLAERVISVKEAAYVLTREGELLRLTPAGLTRQESPGECEAIAATTAGTLLASFVNLGVYEYATGWQKRFPPPYPDTEPERWAYLAESNGQVAFAVTAKPKGGGRDTGPGQNALWVSSGGELKAVTVGGN